MRMTSSFLSRLIELISPRACVICGGRLAEGEEVLCSVCNLHLPRTGYHRCADDNPLAQTFWGKIHIKNAASLFFYNAHSASSNILYSLKYRNHPEIGTYMGRMIAREYMSDGFFDGIDMIIYGAEGRDTYVGSSPELHCHGEITLSGSDAYVYQNVLVHHRRHLPSVLELYPGGQVVTGGPRGDCS